MKKHEPLRPLTYSDEERWYPAAANEDAGFCLEITRTQERLVARVQDQAALNQLSANLVRHGGLRQLAEQVFQRPAAKPASAAARPFHILLALLVGAVLGMLALSAVRYFGTRSSTAPGQVQEIDLPAEEPISAAARARPTGPSAERAPPLGRTIPRMKERAKLPIADTSVASSTEPGLAIQPAESQNSKRAALQKAFDSDEVQTWTEGAETGFVLAGPVQRTGTLNCRIMVQWRRGGEQGEARNISLCKDAEGNWMG